MLNDISQTEKHKCHVILYVETKKKLLVVARGWGEGWVKWVKGGQKYKLPVLNKSWEWNGNLAAIVNNSVLHI